ncbi:MAG: 50S ribosome-binding GTPase, partial [Negativicutes bacterium]|nr:50S ribosome-binding GTPase [Negativicutes bacterium]
MYRDKNQLLIAIAGNPNAGKTTIFNALTGANQHVGNYPGVTVDKKEGHIHYRQGEEKLQLTLV